MKVPCAKVVHSTGMLPMLIRLLSDFTFYMESGAATPKWMAPLLLIVDLLEKVSVCVNRKVHMHKVIFTVDVKFNKFKYIDNSKLLIIRFAAAYPPSPN